MLDLVYTKKFQKQLKLCKKRGLNIDELLFVVEKLRNNEVLDIKYRDHALKGYKNEVRECHINPDWLLIYRKENNQLKLYLLETGTHSDIFS